MRIEWIKSGLEIMGIPGISEAKKEIEVSMMVGESLIFQGKDKTIQTNDKFNESHDI